MDQTNAPLSIALPTAGVKTAFPLIADKQQASFRLTEISQTNTEKGPVIKFSWELSAPAPGNQGKPIAPGELGSKHFENVQLYDKNSVPGGPPPQWALAKIATRLDALLGTGDEGNIKGKPVRPQLDASLVPSLIGKEIVATVKITEYEGQQRNEFSRVEHPGDVKGLGR